MTIVALLLICVYGCRRVCETLDRFALCYFLLLLLFGWFSFPLNCVQLILQVGNLQSELHQLM